MMVYIINKARLKQRSVVLSLLDLKNAFGEVHCILSKVSLTIITSLIRSTILLSTYILIPIPTLSQAAFLLQLILLNVECFKGIALALLFLIYASKHSFSSLNGKKVNLAFHHMMKMIAYSIVFIGSNLRTILLWLLPLNVKFNCY